MSSHSSSTLCPNCGQEADEELETKPFDQTSIFCPHCGFHAYTVRNYYSLEELNEFRIDREMEVLETLPEQDKSLL